MRTSVGISDEKHVFFYLIFVFWFESADMSKIIPLCIIPVLWSVRGKTRRINSPNDHETKNNFDSGFVFKRGFLPLRWFRPFPFFQHKCPPDNTVWFYLRTLSARIIGGCIVRNNDGCASRENEFYFFRISPKIGIASGGACRTVSCSYSYGEVSVLRRAFSL